MNTEVGEKAVMVYRIKIEPIWLTTRNQLIRTNEQRDE